MNSIGPALASVPAPVKSGKGLEQNSKLDNQSDTKFQLPEKKSKGNSDNVANQNDKDDVVNANEKASLENGKSAQDVASKNKAEAALLELINSYQPKNSEKSDASDDEENLEFPAEMHSQGEDDLDAEAKSMAHALVNINDDLKTKTKAGEVDLTSKADKVKADEKSLIADKSVTEKASSSDGKLNDETVKSANLAGAVQDKDISPRKDGQSVQLESVDGKKSSATINAEKAMSDGSKEQGSSQKDDRGSNANISMTDKSGTKMAGVEVLEAKTFIAPTNASTNANNISQAILKSQQISSAAATQSSEPIYQTTQPKALNTLKIQLNPAELGVVTATMKLNGENLQVQLRVDNVEAYRLLSEDSSSIVKALKGQGFGIDQINVTLATSDRGSNQQGNPQNSQSFQAQAEQEQMKNQNGNDRNNNPNGNNGAENAVAVNELAQSESGQNGTYSDGVYL